MLNKQCWRKKVSEGWNKNVAWLPRTEVANILDHLQRALHLHQAVEWRAVLGQHMPARREQHLGGCGSDTHCALQYLSMICPWCATRTKLGCYKAHQGQWQIQGANKYFFVYLTTCKDDRRAWGFGSVWDGDSFRWWLRKQKYPPCTI